MKRHDVDKNSYQYGLLRCTLNTPLNKVRMQMQHQPPVLPIIRNNSDESFFHVSLFISGLIIYDFIDIVRFCCVFDYNFTCEHRHDTFSF